MTKIRSLKKELNEIAKLEKEIPLRAKEYYEGNATISDAAFDKITKRLEELDPESPILRATGWGYVPNANDNLIRHIVPVTGLKKFVDDVDGLKKWMAAKSDEYIITPKFDGASVIITYDNNGDYLNAATRGDGTYGTDITEKLRGKVPAHVEFRGLIVRGELVIKNKNFAHYPNAKHPRNLSSGWVNADSGATVRDEDIDVVMYTWVSEAYITKSKSIDMMKKLGFNVAPYKVVDSNTKYADNDWLDADKYEYPCDGVVLSAQYPDDDGKWYEIAFKTNKETAVTTVLDIEWSFEREKFVPMLVVEPVTISGATISKVSAYNLGKLTNEYHAGIGSKVEITRSGGVIPAIVRVITTSDNIKLPTHCPDCGAKLNVKGPALVCGNPYCSAKTLSGVASWLKVLAEKNGVKGMAGVAVNPIIKDFNISSVVDLLTALPAIKADCKKYRKPVRDLFGKPYEKLTLDEAILAMKVPGIADKAAAKLAEYIATHDEADIDDLKAAKFNKAQVESIKIYWGMILFVKDYVME